MRRWFLPIDERVLDGLDALLKHRRFAWILAAVAFFVHAPTLRTGFLIDDYVHRFFAQGHSLPGGPRGAWDLYRFADGGPGTAEAIAQGFHPWWAEPGIKLAFFRPITSLIRVAEEKLFHDSPFGPHVISCVLFVLLTLGVLALLREWIGGAAASVGAVLFAIDDAHATTVLWIAARHTLVATLFVVLALLSFLRSRDRVTSIASGGLFFLGLLSSESSLGGIAYFIAFAFLLPSTKTTQARVLSLVPVLTASLVWFGIYVALGYGARGSAFYIDPGGDPVRFAVEAAFRAPVVALAQIFVPPAEIATSQAIPRGLHLGFALIVCTSFAWLSMRVHGRARALPMLFAFFVSILPGCGTAPDDRLLLLPGIAAFGLLGLFARAIRNGNVRFPRLLAGAIGVVHVFLALTLLPLRELVFAKTFSGVIERGAASLPADPSVAGKLLVVVSAPDGLLPSSMFLHRLLAGDTLPRGSALLMACPSAPVIVSRPEPAVLELESAQPMMNDPFLAAYRLSPFKGGMRVETHDLIVEVLAVERAKPKHLRITFKHGISVETHRFITWEGHGFVTFPMPSVGASVTLPAVDWNAFLAGPRQ
jgi:hypothetical protein